MRAQDEAPLAAGEPVFLRHPEINDSVGNPVLCLAFLGDGARLATGATSGVLVWDAAGGELRQTLEVDERAVDSLALDPRSERLLAGGAAGVIRIFDAKTLAPIRTLGPAPGAVRALSISPDGKLLATVSPNAQPRDDSRPFGIQLWDLSTGEQLRTIPHPPSAFGATSLTFLPGGKQLLTAQDRALRVFDVESGKELQTVDQLDLPRTLDSIALSGDGRRLVTGAFEPKVRLWDTQTWKQTRAWEAHIEQPPPEQGVSSVAFSPNGRYVLSGGMDGMVCVWDATSGHRLLTLDGGIEAPRRGWITGLAVTPDNRRLAATHYGGMATIWPLSAAK